MEELCVTGEVHRIPQKELYLAYVDWCEELKQKPQNYRLFNRQLKERNYQLVTKKFNGRATKVWSGIMVRPSEHTGNNVVSFRGI